jgi:hypothetical protein
MKTNIAKSLSLVIVSISILSALWKAVSCEFKRDNMIIEVNGGESVAKS